MTSNLTEKDSKKSPEIEQKVEPQTDDADAIEVTEETLKAETIEVEKPKAKESKPKAEKPKAKESKPKAEKPKAKESKPKESKEKQKSQKLKNQNLKQKSQKLKNQNLKQKSQKLKNQNLKQKSQKLKNKKIIYSICVKSNSQLKLVSGSSQSNVLSFEIIPNGSYFSKRVSPAIALSKNYISIICQMLTCLLVNCSHQKFRQVCLKLSLLLQLESYLLHKHTTLNV